MTERDHESNESGRQTLTLGRRGVRPSRTSAANPVNPAGSGNKTTASITKPVAYVDPRPPLPDADQVLRPGPQPGGDLDWDTDASSRSLLDGDTHDLDPDELGDLSIVDHLPGRIDAATALPPLERLLTSARKLRNGAAEHDDLHAHLDDLLERIESSISQAAEGIEPEHYVDLYSTKRIIERTIFDRTPDQVAKREKQEADEAAAAASKKHKGGRDADPREVRIQMHDPQQRDEIMQWLRDETAPLAELPGGQLLQREMLKAHDLSELVLGRSVRASDRAQDTLMSEKQSRPLLVQRVLDGEIDDAAYCVDFLNACVGHGLPDKDETPDWPHTSAGVPWEVDHVLELWQGGADDPSNFLALHPALHAMKTEIMERFRVEFLYKRRGRD